MSTLMLSALKRAGNNPLIPFEYSPPSYKETKRTSTFEYFRDSLSSLKTRVTRDGLLQSCKSLISSCAHSTLGTALNLPINLSSLLFRGESEKKDHVQWLQKKKHCKVKKVSITHNGGHIEAFIIGKKNAVNNGKWTIFYTGLAEDPIHYPKEYLVDFCELTKSNLVLFNFSDFGTLHGSCISKETYLSSSLAVLEMTLDKTNGLAANKVCLFGSSLGGGIIGAMLEDERFKKDENVQYITVKDRTFSTFDLAIHGFLDSKLMLLNPSLRSPHFLDKLFRACNWNFPSDSSFSKESTVPEIILQSAKKPSKCEDEEFTPYQITSEDALLPTDNLISKEASLAVKILNAPQNRTKQSVVLGISDPHCVELAKPTINAVANRVNNLYAFQEAAKVV